MAFEQFREQAVAPILRAVYTLSNNEEIPKEERLDKATDEVGIAGEYTDSELAGLLPGPIGAVASWVVDLDPVDQWQREYLWKPITELAYQGMQWYKGAVSTANLFVQNVVKPVLDLIPTLTDPTMTGAQKHAKVKGLILGVFAAIGEGLVELLPPGLKPFASYILNTDEVEKFLEWLAGFIAEVLYNVWRVLSGDPQLVGATA